VLSFIQFQAPKNSLGVSALRVWRRSGGTGEWRVCIAI